MSLFLLKGDTKVNGVATDGLICVAYLESRFPVDGNGNVIPPMQGQAVPDANAPDGGPVTSGSAYGGQGQYQIQVPDAGNYFVGCSTFFNPSLIAWEGPLMATPHTSLQALALSNAYTTPTRQLAPTISVASGSNGNVLPQSTIFVNTTTGIPTSGLAALFNVSLPINTIVSYTSVTGGGTPSLNGCTGGTGTLATGQFVFAPTYQNSTRRRMLLITVVLTVGAVNSASASSSIYATLAGAFGETAATLVQNPLTGTAVASTHWIPLTVIVDPDGFYAASGSSAGSGSSSSMPSVPGFNPWIEMDL